MSMQKGMFPDQNLRGIKPIAEDGREMDGGDALLSELGGMTLSTAMERLEVNELCPKGLSFFCGVLDTTSMVYRMWVAELGGNLGVVETPEQIVEALARYKGEVDFALVDMDACGDVSAAIDLCVYIRNSTPEVTVILVSSDVSSDDYTSERMMACDATLRAPVSSKRLVEAIRHGHRNNAFYRAWRADRKAEADNAA